MMQSVDLAYAQEWKFDHGIMVPLSFLTPRYDLPVIPGEHQLPGAAAHSAQALLRVRPRAAPRVRRACRSASPSSAPAASRIGRRRRTPERSTRRGIARSSSVFSNGKRDELLAYRDEETWREAGQGGFEIRTFIAVSGATEGATGELWFYAPIPIFAVGCTVAVMKI